MINDTTDDIAGTIDWLLSSKGLRWDRQLDKKATISRYTRDCPETQWVCRAAAASLSEHAQIIKKISVPNTLRAPHRTVDMGASRTTLHNGEKAVAKAGNLLTHIPLRRKLRNDAASALRVVTRPTSRELHPRNPTDTL